MLKIIDIILFFISTICVLIEFIYVMAKTLNKLVEIGKNLMFNSNETTVDLNDQLTDSFLVNLIKKTLLGSLIGTILGHLLGNLFEEGKR